MLKLDPEEMSETIRTCPESIARLCHLPSDDDHDDRDDALIINTSPGPAHVYEKTHRTPKYHLHEQDGLLKRAQSGEVDGSQTCDCECRHAVEQAVDVLYCELGVDCEHYPGRDERDLGIAQLED
jgi:hypothetical protein